MLTVSLHVADRTLNTVFLTPSGSIDEITCCKQKSEPWIVDSLSLKFVRLQVANIAANLGFVTPSLSID
jgi:hypothetical protein